MEALGGPAESLDPALLMMSASGEDGGSLSIKRSEMDGIDVRLQVSNGIPIQVRLNTSRFPPRSPQTCARKSYNDIFSQKLLSEIGQRQIFKLVSRSLT